MWDFLFGRTMQKMVALSTIFWILTTLELSWDDIRWWAIFVLMLVISYLDRTEGEQIGAANLLNMSRSRLIRVKDFMDRVERGGDHSVEELNEILKKEENKDE